ncbi:MAG: hypothetical protein EHM45_03275 [Desulfobacteraceae bacterium]|nr:MAG: hypothetical protein EHM45_03275 [Desulfobacteraceae bacterium]
MNDAVKEVITGMTDGELLEAVEKTYSGYTREALDIAMAELKRRGIPFANKAIYYPASSEDLEPIMEEREEGAEVKAEILCPQCKNTMKSGLVYLRGTVWGWFLYGSSYKHCYFSAIGKEEGEKVMDNSETCPAYRCQKCGIVLFKTTE